MTPKFSKSDVFRTNNKIVGLAGGFAEFHSQFLLQGEERTGTYEGRSYFNCYDIYDVNGIRFLVGNGAPDTHNYSKQVLKELGTRAKELTGWTQEAINERKRLLGKFCDSIKNGIRDPEPVTSFGYFKKQLVEQKKMWPDKSYCEISKELLEETSEESIKEKINAGIKKVYDRMTSLQKKDTPEEKKMEFTLQTIAVVEKGRQEEKEKNQNPERMPECLHQGR